MSGAGRAVVVATGRATEFGRIATLFETASPGDTPLEQKLDQLGGRLLVAGLAIVASYSAWACCAGSRSSSMGAVGNHRVP